MVGIDIDFDERIAQLETAVTSLATTVEIQGNLIEMMVKALDEFVAASKKAGI